ncbi:venom dipeptidyl peptidase 4 [Trichonephila inaurata madagascariensis]|uniref:Venom dipeptidyl peptidase 4 n=1 Tax=Trichonephila inaurata madagascariensis TaxID=2747483 RepID=A0A8X7CT65_9ARAC|nr:venom dipeptidyl peptidase 4 [Trichonephila inaurata madagascariensis]
MRKISALYPADDPEGYLQYADWGPRDNQLVYAYGNNIYYLSEVNSTHHPITTNGVESVIFNGVPDWLYEAWWRKPYHFPVGGGPTQPFQLAPERREATPRYARPVSACVVYEQSPPSRKGWVDLQGPIFFGQGGKNWYLRLPLPEGKHGHYQHVAMANNDILFIWIFRYYLTTLENRPGERHLFSVSGKKARSATFTKCLTCEEGESCLFFNVIFSPDSQYYVLECLGPGVPKVEIRSIYNQTFDVLDANDDLSDLLKERTLPQIRTFQVPLRGGYKAQVRLFLPPGIKEDEVLLYPLIVFADSAPGSQLVTAEFQLHWGSYLSSRRNHIYAWIDGRGSGSQGDKMMHEVYYRLGSVEVEDQIEVTRYLKDNLAFVHPKHTAIWGWFYGGYVAALALASENTVFKCAISVAPVTSWLYYDSVYTERYMGTPLPQDNYLGFEKSSLVKKAHKFKGKKFLLMHGTADNKVHVQQSLMFIKALVDEGVLFQTQVSVIVL